MLVTAATRTQSEMQTRVDQDPFLPPGSIPGKQAAAVLQPTQLWTDVLFKGKVCCEA